MSTNVKDRTRPRLVEQSLHPIEAAGKILGVSNGVVYRLISARQLGSVRVGRRIMIPEADLSQYLSERYTPAK